MVFSNLTKLPYKSNRSITPNATMPNKNATIAKDVKRGFVLLTMVLFHRILGAQPTSEGPTPLIVLHGLLGSSDNWQTLGSRWADHRPVVLIDQRNHGRSPHHPSHGYPDMVVDLLEAVADFEERDNLKNLDMMSDSSELVAGSESGDGHDHSHDHDHADEHEGETQKDAGAAQ